MAKSISVKPKSGRPATGRHPFVGIRVPATLIKTVEGWGARNEAGSRSEAIRRLVELGLSASAPPSRPVPAKARAKAADIAAATIDEHLDPTMPDEEKANRKRRLLKGPREFRELRRDQPKSKGKP